MNNDAVIRGNHPVLGVILREVPDEGQNAVQTLMADGRIITHVSYDILYVVSNFVDTFLIKRCGIEDKPVNTKQLMARVTVAEKVRAFNKAAEDLFNGYAALFQNVYPRVSAADKDAWASITVTEAAKLLNVQHLDRNLVLHAVYSHLMKQSHMFLMDNHNFLSTQTFYVRPRAQVERFKRVSHLMHTDSPFLGQFAMRAKTTIAELRTRTANTKNQSPSFSPADELTFTEGDQLFIRLLLDSLVDIRSVQTDPYTPLVCHIIKAVGLYDGDVDSAQVRQFLVDMGVLAPWQDVASLIEVQPGLITPLSDPEPPAAARGGGNSGPTTTTTLGVDDFYSTDPLESIRHDFWQLPVYAIDDHGAQELDDGISVERDASDSSCLWVHIHVADPTAILPPTHSFARRARDMVHTHYFHHGSQSMLPESLVGVRLSLGRSAVNGEGENVMTFSAKVDSTGNITDYKVRAGIVRSVRVMKYDDIDATMSFDCQDAAYPFGRPPKQDSTPLNLRPEDVENLQLLDLFCKRMVANRLSTPSLSYGLESPELIVSPNPLPVSAVDSIRPGSFCGEPKITYGVRDGLNLGSRQIVAEAAQVANRVASLFGRDHGIPLARRSLAAPVRSGAALADLLKLRDPTGWVDFFEVRRRAISFNSGQYTLEPAEHWTLGIAKGEGYTRATSPLRRYGDLVTHWQIKHALLHKRPLFSAEEMQSTFGYIGAKEQRWKWVEKAHDRWWALAFVKRWMENNRKAAEYSPLESLTGRATARAREDIFRGLWVQEVHIAKLGLFGVLEGAAEQEIGAEVAVSIDKIVLTTHPVLRLKPR
jgi:exoribonuclease-2